MKTLLLGGAFALAAGLLSAPASAWVHACNQSSSAAIWIAYADHSSCDPTDFFGEFECGSNGCSDDSDQNTPSHATGWYKVASGACTTPNGGDADEFFHFMYAEDGKGSVWGPGPNDPEAEFCTPWAAFDRCTNTSSSYEDVLGCGMKSGTYRRLWYQNYGQPTSNNWTLNFTD